MGAQQRGGLQRSRGFIGDPDRYSRINDAFTHADRDRDIYRDRNIHANRDIYGDCHGKRDEHSKPDRHIEPDPYTERDRDGYADDHPNFYAHADPVGTDALPG